MKAFKTKEDMLDAYAEQRLDEAMLKHLAYEIESGVEHKPVSKEWIVNQREVSRMTGEHLMKYMAPFYCGGWIIKGFGYSTERIGTGSITKENAGDPINASELIGSFGGVA